MTDAHETNDTIDLIRQLATRAAMLMEDLSPLALAVGSPDAPNIHAHLQSISEGLQTATSLVLAAQALIQIDGK